MVPLVSEVRIVAPSPAGWWPRARAWSTRVALAIAIAILALHVALPALVAWRVRRALADAGFPDARLHVAHVGWHAVRVTGVELGDGFTIDELELDAGAAMLVGGDGPRTATIRGARVPAAALARLAAPGGGGGGSGDTPAIERVVVEDAVVAAPAGAIAVTATITLPARRTPFAIDALARIPRWPLGPLTVDDVAITARTTGARVHVCATGAIAGAPAEACTDVPATGLARLRSIDVTATAHAAPGARAWSARGTAQVAWSGEGPIAITRGHVDAEAPAQDADAITTAPITLSAELGGPLAGLTAVGLARTDRVELRAGSVGATFRSVALPFTLRADRDGVIARAPLAVTAADATLAVPGTSLALLHPTVVLREAGQRVELGSPGAWRVAGAHASALGGELSLDPVAFAARTHVLVHARGIRLAELLARFGKGYVAGAGRLDGEVALEVGGGATTIVGAALRARGAGTLEVTEPSWRDYALGAIPDFAIHRRIAGALADFGYTRLDAVLGPPGADPELRVTLHGTGRTVAQELDLTINLRNVRETIGAAP